VAIIYGLEIKSTDGLKNYALTNGLSIIEHKNKLYIGEMISIKSTFRSCEVVELIKLNKQWHPRFVSHINRAIREYQYDFNSDPSFYSFEHLNAKTIV
jgi:hypothetical protein